MDVVAHASVGAATIPRYGYAYMYAYAREAPPTRESVYVFLGYTDVIFTETAAFSAFDKYGELESVSS